MLEREITRELPAGYYLDNFLYLINFVHEHYAARLTAPELSWRDCFLNLETTAQKLYVRLLLRRGPVFRVERLRYDEVPDIKGAVTTLLDARLLGPCDDLPAELVLQAFNKSDLAVLRAAADLPKSIRKPDLIEHLAQQDVRPEEAVVTPLGLDVLAVYKLLFFGNLYQDFSEFVLSDMGFTPFEDYVVDPGSNWLSERRFVDMTLHLHQLNELSHELIATGEPDDLKTLVPLLQLQPEHQRHQVRLDRIVNRVARQFERYGKYDLALQLFAVSTLTPARERQARILAAQGMNEHARDICLEVYSQPADEQEAEFSLRFLKKLRKHCEVPLDDATFAWLNFKPDVCDVVLANEAGKRVETLAAEWIQSCGKQAFYVENGLFNSLFGLTFWDIIFQPVDNAFYNPYQRGPADLFTPEFQTARHQVIAERLLLILDRPRWLTHLQQTFTNKFPRANHFVSWQWPEPELLFAVAERINGQAIQQVFVRMMEDLKNHRSGFPDLVVIHGDQVELVEVKGPGDKLQEHQRRWLRHFEEVGLAASVLNVVFAS